MTAHDHFKAFMAASGLEPTRVDRSDNYRDAYVEYAFEAGEGPKIEGYGGFSVGVGFDRDGELIFIGAWE